MKMLLKLVLKAGALGVASYGVTKVLEHYHVAERLQELGEEAIAKFIASGFMADDPTPTSPVDTPFTAPRPSGWSQ